MEVDSKLQRAILLTDQLIGVLDGVELCPGAHTLAKRLRKALRPVKPMREILARVPGVTLNERIGRIGISRQGYYNLEAGRYRPSGRTAARLAKLTGVSEAVIRGEKHG